jgi:hypothetical protein
MGFYNVVKPCVVGQLHYVRPTTEPIEVDDDTAAPLVDSGCLEPYQPGAGVFEMLPDSVPLTDPLNTEVGQAVRDAAEEIEVAADPAESPQRRPRTRRPSED